MIAPIVVWPSEASLRALGLSADAARAALESAMREPAMKLGRSIADAIKAARALEPVPRNRHERRRAAALRRRAGSL